MTPILADRVIALNGVTGHVGATQPRSFTTTARKWLQPSTLQPGLRGGSASRAARQRFARYVGSNAATKELTRSAARELGVNGTTVYTVADVVSAR
jgi:NAD(P)-dependent dehydrogenase (short-subunit alcohol dehydrogenase family)